MKRIDTSTAVPDQNGPGKAGFRDGNLSLGVVPTDFNAAWPNGVQEEIASVIEAAGLTLNGGDFTQLFQAIQALVGPGRLLRTSVYVRVAGVQMVSVDGGALTTTGASTFTEVEGNRFAIIEATGAGGGSGGNPTTTGSQCAISGGAGGGAYGMRRETSTLTGVAVLVGAAGAAGVAGAAGGAGGTSSFGAFLTAPGGSGSDGGIAYGGVGNSGIANGGAAPTGANMLALQGGPGGQAICSAIAYAGSQQGGASGTGVTNGYGAGAPGKYNGAGTATPQNGWPAPASGVIVVKEYA